MSLAELSCETFYPRLEQCQSALLGVDAIDYYFANYVYSVSTEVDEFAHFTQDQRSLWYHLLLALSFAQRMGNTCLRLQDLHQTTLWQAEQENDTSYVTSINEHKGYTFPDSKAFEGLIEKLDQLLAQVEGIVYKYGRLYTSKFDEYEAFFCEQLKLRSKVEGGNDDLSVHTGRLMHIWPLLFTEAADDNHTDFQQLALMHAITRNFSIMSGGAGTGKTYTLSRLIIVLISVLGVPPSRIGLLAPTGKAANRLASSLQSQLSEISQLSVFKPYEKALSNLEVQTIHRLLGIHPVDNRCKYHQHRLLTFDYVIVDEASMVDLSLMHKLLRAMPQHCRLILVGDPNQLPSVDAGCLLADLLACAPKSLQSATISELQTLNPCLYLAPSYTNSNVADDHERVHQSILGKPDYLVSLAKSRRSKQAILDFADAVLDQNEEQVHVLSTQSSTQWNNVAITGSHTQAFHALLQQSVLPQVKRVVGADTLDKAWKELTRYACLIPNRKGFAGVDWVNTNIERMLSADFAWVKQHQVYRGKPIMITQNDYSLGLFNGDIGIIWPDENEQLWAYFPSTDNQALNGLLPYSIYTLPRYEAVYAMTIHKTQGSEYQWVDILLPNHSAKHLSKELLYTAVTRAKEKIRVFADEDTLMAALKQKVQRVSGLAERLKVK